MSDPGLNGVEKWWDGKGDPKQSPQYLKALELRDRPGMSEAARDRLTDAIKHYEFITTPAGGDEPAAPEATAEQKPTPAAPAAEKAPEAPPAEEPSVWRALASGASLGGNRHFAALGAKLASLLGPKEEIPREYARGSEMADVQASEKAANRAAEAAHPYAHGIGMAAPAALVMAAPELYPALQGAGWAGVIGSAGLGGMALGGVKALNESDAQTPSELALDTARGANEGGLSAATTAGVLSAGGEAAQNLLSPLLRTGGHYLRGMAAGGFGSQKALKTLEENPGINSPTELGAAVERQGLPGKRWWGPMSAHDYATASEADLPAANAAIENSVDDAMASGTPLRRLVTRDPVTGRMQRGPVLMSTDVPRSALESDVRAALDKVQGGRIPDRTAQGQQYARTLEDQLAELSQLPENLTPRDLLTLKRNLSPNAGYKPNEMSIPGTTPSKEAYQDYQGIVRRALANKMNETPYGEAFAKGNRDYGDLATINKIADAQARAQSTMGPFRVFRDLAGAGIGHMTGVGGELGGIAATEGMAHYGADLGASLLKGGAATSGAVGRALSGAARPAAMTAAVEAPDAWDRYSTEPLKQRSAPTRDQGTRGQMVPDVAWKLYQEDPHAFGPFADNLYRARQRGEGQFAAELARLESDPEFARTVLPRLRQMTVAKE